MRTIYLISALTLVPAIADAHISLTYPPPRTTELKQAVCGVAGSARGTNVTTLEAGSKLTVQWKETIDHPGHYRISLDMDGQDFIVPPDATNTTEGMPNVVKDLIPDIQGTLPVGGRPYTFEITLPMMACTNCTLQVIQLMTDKAPYTIDAASDDIYYQCADITLTMPGSGGDAGTNTEPDGGSDPGGGNNGSVSGGCSSSRGAGLPIAFALLGLAAPRRRRR